jgi:hypothetical protein
MTDHEIAATVEVLKGNFYYNTIMLITPRCLNFRGHTIRFRQGWVNLRNQSYTCNCPLDLLKAMASTGIIRRKSVDFIHNQIQIKLNKHSK